MLSSRSKGSQQMGSKAKSESRSNLYYTLPEHLPFLDLARNHGVPFISLTKGASTAAAASNNSPFPNDINSTAMNDFFNSLSNSTLFSNNNGVVSNNNAHEKHPTNRKTSEPSPISSPSTSIISKDQYIQLAKQEEHLLEQIFRNCTHGQSKLPKNFFFNILNMMIYEYSIDMEEILRLDSIQYPPTTNAHHLLRSPTTTKTHHTNFSHNNMPYPYANVNKNNNFNNSHSIKKSASTQSLQSVGNNNNNNNSNNANADSLSCKIPNSPSTSSLLAGLHHPSSSNRATNLGTTNDIAVFSQQWFDGFLQRHAELRNRVSKSVGTCDIDTFDLWFCEYLSGIRDRKIETSNIYNMVDTGIYRGSKNDEFLRNCDSDEHNNESGNKTNNNNNISDDYTEDEHKVIRDPGNAGYFLPLGVAKLQRAQMNKHNKKYPLSVIETICADGSSLAPFVIINDQLINQNSQSDLSQELVQEYKSKEWKFEYTPDGWTSANEAYLWLVNHFDPLTRAKLSHPNAPRALVLAGELRYLSFSFFKYAAQHNIALFFMPAKTCEVLQPFTVGPGKQFQTMGGFFSFSSITLDDQTIDDQKRDDNINNNNNNNNNIINRPEGLTLSINSNKGKQPSIQWSNFFEMIMQARFVILNHKKISDSWKLAGLSPFNPSLVVGIKFPKIKDPPLLVKVLQLKYDGNIPLINNNNNNKINKSPSISSNLSLPNLNNSNKKKNNNNDLSSSISLRKRKASATISTLNNTTNVTNVNNLFKKGTTYSNNSLDGKIIPSTTTVGPPSLAGGDVTGQVGGSNSLRLKQLLMRMKSLVPQDSADFAISFNMYNKLVAELEQIVVKLESESASLLKKSKISFNGNNNSVDNNNNNNNNNNNKMIDQNLFNSLLFSKFTNEGGNNNNNNNNFSIDIDTMFDIKQLEMNQSNINAHNINNNMPSSSSSASLSIKHNKLQQQQSTNNDLKSHAEWLQDLYKSQQNHQKQLMNMKSEESNESKNKSKVINNNNNNEKRNNNNIIIKNPQLDLFANSYSVIGPDFCDEINELMNMNNNLFYDNRSSITSTTINNNNNNNNGFNMSDGLIKNSDKLLMNIYNNTSSSSSNYSTTMTTTTTTTKTSNNLKNNNISPPPPPSITPSSSSNSPSEGISSPHNKKSPNIYNNNTTNTTSSGNGNAAIIMPSSSSPSTNSMFSMGMKYKNNNHR